MTMRGIEIPGWAEEPITGRHGSRRSASIRKIGYVGRHRYEGSARQVIDRLVKLDSAARVARVVRVSAGLPA